MVLTPLAPEADWVAHLEGVTVSMRVVSAGKGYGYLLRSVVQGDGDAAQASGFTRYFTEAGTPPGVWMGKGVAFFGAGELRPGMAVTPEQLQTLLGRGNDPVTGANLGQPFREYPSVVERTAALTARVDRALPAGEFDAEATRIQAEQAVRGPQTATAGFDLTFSVLKSVSVLWGLADANTQELIVEAHHAAVAQVLDLFEREVAATRTGHAGIAQVPVVGVAATAYDHWDSRANDPQLHTHVVVSNKVMAAHDGRWRTLDSRAVHHAMVGLSEHYNAVLADRLTGTFGLSWERRERGEDRTAQWEIRGVGEDLIAAFSSRARAIDVATDAKIAAYVAEHGHRPTGRRIVQLRAEATLDTRPEKTIRALSELTAEWRTRARDIVGGDPTEWARTLTTPREPARGLALESVPMFLIDQAAADVVDVVAERRSTWRHWNLWAEASRRTMGWRFATAADRERVVALITDAATRRSVPLTPGEVATTPAGMRRGDGTSTLRPKHSTYYSSERLLGAEDRLLALGEERTTTLVVPQRIVETMTGAWGDGVVVGGEQAAAITQILASGRRVDVLVGPAGTGKSTAMAALAGAWTEAHGAGSVVGMAPSAAAAQVLAEDIGMGCDNTAKWVHDHARGRADFRPGQLVILDEATLASTRALETIATRASEVGAKVVLVGDPAQLQSVDAGGAFNMLTAARGGDLAELVEVRRFVHAWEKHASLALRDGDVAAIDAYAGRGRIVEGTTETMIDAAYRAWQHDLTAGRSSILVTEAAESVRHLNERARAERVQQGLTATREAALREEVRASVGDVVITRRNDRRLRTGPDTWVRNGDRWTVTHVGPGGTLEVRRIDAGGATVRLPAGYVARHVDLGYAVTAHRAQGMTVDTAHVVVSASTTRENLYVSMTRGRHANTAYVALDQPDPLHATPAETGTSARTVLFGVLNHSGLELSAHQTITAEQERWTGIAQLAAEYETIATTAQQGRWTRLVTDTLTRAGGLTTAEASQVTSSETFAVLTAELRRAEANHHDVENLLPRLAAQRTLLDADDVAAVLTARLARATRRPAPGTTPNLIAGLIPAAAGPMPADAARALGGRRQLIETRARTLADAAVRDRAPWVCRIGDRPHSAGDRERWLAEVAVVAAYRDRYGITSTAPLGPSTQTLLQERDRPRAAEALRRAEAIAEKGRSAPSPTRAPGRSL
ncbi:MobF family relaxase [Georgenia muralis]|uniref:Conjugative relaxase-like TrwC/TraI family protein n=1 Tax=Georgenia muralis TaxID=154117 RepID=A0A3N4ZSS5_9MICO|nr:MobF family relaxase [Georgenia muralis]RPF28568.1 conjugative relaxase-like TrwC/TraI family protein [Georgenia muralis]